LPFDDRQLRSLLSTCTKFFLEELKHGGTR
jgi:hypothetical protein